MDTVTMLIRILVAALLGGAIGMERAYRAKEAGFRTHFLVALGAALFMILSAHGFNDVVFTDNVRLDVSRIAAQVVSGIGFIGAGTIIFQRQAVHGLTTAAGLWVTAAIGMAAGAGLFIIAAFSTVLVLIGLEILNSLMPHTVHRSIKVTLTAADEETVQRLLSQIREDGALIVSYSLSQNVQCRQLVRMELKPSRSNYADRVLHYAASMEGLSIENIE